MADGLFAGIFNNNNSNPIGGSGGAIGGGAFVNVGISGDVTTSAGAEFDIYNNDNGSGSGGGTIGTDAAINVNLGNITSGPEQDSNALVVQIDNRGGSIGGNAMINFAASGHVDAQGNAILQILNFNDGGSRPGTIGGDASINVATGGDISAQGNAVFSIYNSDFSSGSGAGAIVGDATVNVSAASITAGALFETIVNLGSSIGGNAAIGVVALGGIISGGDTAFSIYNADNGSGAPAGIIGSDATINVSAGDISIAGSLENAIYNKFVGLPATGSIGGNAMLTFDAGAITVQNGASFKIDNNDGGEIGGNALINLSATTLSVDGALGLLEHIINFGGGNIGGSADLSFNLTGDLTTQAEAKFQVVNNNDGGGGGTIGGDATINVSAQNITANPLSVFMLNDGGGNIGGNANLNFTLTGDLTTQGDANFLFNNNNGGTIGGNAAVSISAANITANSLVAQIDNTGGSIGASTDAGAAINMNVSGTASVTTDATVAIYGSDGAVGGAAININGGNYNVGGTFLTYIDGNGMITFANATAHADVLKAGVFGANGVLNVGGGILSADTELKLYASGSNGSLNFLSNVTLGGNAVKILAANSITIFNNIVVTINGPAAQVYTNNANYTGSGGNGTTTGTFAGAGANNPLPLDQAPPFGPSAPSHPTVRPGGNIPHWAGNRGTINVSNTAELLALLDGATVGPDGRVTVPASKNTRDLRNSSRTDINALPREARRILMQQMRDRSITRVGNRRLL
jgi:hypothetical protein